MPPEIVTTEEDPLDITCSALVIGAFEGPDGAQLGPVGERADERLDGLLSEALRDARFKGKVASTSLITTLGRLPAGVIAIAGLGPKDTVGPTQVRRAAGASAKRLVERTEIVTALADGLGETEATASIEGHLLGAYRFKKYVSKDERPDQTTRLVVCASRAATERGQIYAEATNLARDLVNEPPDRLSPKAFADRATEIAGVARLGCKVYTEDELEVGAFGGLLAVSSGSTEPPRLVDLTYSPEGATARITIVGKGITYDTGGLSIKPAASMKNMKTDMGGGAAVIAVMSALPRLKVPVAVRALIPMAENMIGPAAMRVDDVIVHYGGRTTEMSNADAEGRLVLADALALASEDPPDVIVDIATLTGHIVIGLGEDVAGLFSNNESLTEEIRAAGTLAGEPFWPMPLFAGYHKQLDSDVADQKSVGKREGGAVTAALFLQSFVGEGIPWAHLDIAGPGRWDSANELGPKGGSGFGTRTLLGWIERRGSADR